MVNVLWNTITLPFRYDPDSIPTTPPKCTDTVKLECGKVHFHVPNRTYGLCGSLKYKQIFDHRVSKSGDGIGLRMFPLCCRISMYGYITLVFHIYIDMTTRNNTHFTC